MTDLVTPDKLAGFPGAPFSESVARAAGESIRRLCGWHIAPQKTETIRVDHNGGRILFLPTLHVVNILSIRHRGRGDRDEGRELSGWTWSQQGMVELSQSLPFGFRSVEVELTHGYEECPADLLPVIARAAKRRAIQESLGSRSITYEAEQGETVLDSYKIGALA